jgi:hypothetical protein
MQAEGQSHFHRIEESRVAPSSAIQVGLLSYAGATRVPVGPNFMATPYVTSGGMVNLLPRRAKFRFYGALSGFQ